MYDDNEDGWQSLAGVFLQSGIEGGCFCRWTTFWWCICEGLYEHVWKLNIDQFDWVWFSWGSRVEHRSIWLSLIQVKVDYGFSRKLIMDSVESWLWSLLKVDYGFCRKLIMDSVESWLWSLLKVDYGFSRKLIMDSVENRNSIYCQSQRTQMMLVRDGWVWQV
jgi:hypothetical protein